MERAEESRRKGNNLADVTRDPRAYELMAVFIPELSDEDLTLQIDRVSGYITDQNGTITEVLHDSPWGRRRLAYTMRFNSIDYRDGVYVLYHFDGIPSSITEIERELKLNTSLMRYLLVHNDPLAGEKVRPGSLEEGAAEATPADEGAEETESAAPAEAAPAVAETPPEAPAAAEAAPVEEAPAPAAEEPAVAEATPAEDAPAPAEAAPAADAPAATNEAPAPEAAATDEETKED
jgi:ribosomal protein S6